MTQDLTQGPIFVLGSVRSGSTMLRLILDSHPNIAIGPESGFIRGAAAVRTIPYWDYGSGWYQRFGWTDEEFDEYLRRFFAGIFERYAEREGKPRWGEKTPFHVWHTRDMARLFPEARFLAIVRHPGAVSASRSDRWSEPFDVAANDWTAVNSELLMAAAELEPGRIALCRYEDVVLAPQEVLPEILEFLGEPWSDNVLEHHRVQRQRGTPRIVDGHTSSRRPLEAEAVTRWRRDVTPPELEVLERVAGDLARRLGYRTDDPVPVVTMAHLAGRDSSSSRPRHLLDSEDVGRVGVGVAPPVSPPDELSEAEVRERLRQAQIALARFRRRRAVRYVDAFRRAQRARSVADVRDIVRDLRQRSRMS